MVAYDGAEVCELIIAYIWNVLSRITAKTILDFTEMMDWPFWKITVDLNQNR